jgi:hypothetical protein
VIALAAHQGKWTFSLLEIFDSLPLATRPDRVSPSDVAWMSHDLDALKMADRAPPGKTISEAFQGGGRFELRGECD